MAYSKTEIFSKDVLVAQNIVSGKLCGEGDCGGTFGLLNLQKGGKELRTDPARGGHYSTAPWFSAHQDSSRATFVRLCSQVRCSTKQEFNLIVRPLMNYLDI